MGNKRYNNFFVDILLLKSSEKKEQDSPNLRQCPPPRSAAHIPSAMRPPIINTAMASSGKSSSSIFISPPFLVVDLFRLLMRLQVFSSPFFCKGKKIHVYNVEKNVSLCITSLVVCCEYKRFDKSIKFLSLFLHLAAQTKTPLIEGL
jgi:hypothetical protein